MLSFLFVLCFSESSALLLSRVIAEIDEKVLLQLEFSHGQDELKPQHFTILCLSGVLWP